MRHEDEFPSDEEAQQHTFLENEAQRDAESQQRGGEHSTHSTHSRSSTL